MEIKKRCKNCGKTIYSKDHQVNLVTKKEGKIRESVYFHIFCWREYFNNAVLNRAKENVAIMQKSVQGIFKNPALQNVLSQVEGIDPLMRMLNTDLSTVVKIVPSEEKPVKKEKWKKKSKKKKS